MPRHPAPAGTTTAGRPAMATTGMAMTNTKATATRTMTGMPMVVTTPMAMMRTAMTGTRTSTMPAPPPKPRSSPSSMATCGSVSAAPRMSRWKPASTRPPRCSTRWARRRCHADCPGMEPVSHPAALTAGAAKPGRWVQTRPPPRSPAAAAGPGPPAGARPVAAVTARPRLPATRPSPATPGPARAAPRVARSSACRPGPCRRAG
ncbi:MAG: hypothetical protein JWP20_2185 [Roseomonas sp.]|nr:hypothetical protein [Roseomonas sp.]